MHVISRLVAVVPMAMGIDYIDTNTVSDQQTAALLFVTLCLYMRVRLA